MDIKFLTEVSLQRKLMKVLCRQRNVEKLAEQLEKTGCCARSNFPGTPYEYADFLVKEVMYRIAYGSIRSHTECEKMLKRWYSLWRQELVDEGKLIKPVTPEILSEPDILDAWVRSTITKIVLKMDGKL